MKNLRLVHRKFKLIGLLMFLPAIMIPLIWKIYFSTFFIPLIIGKVFFLVGVILIMLSPEEIEDEFISSCRLQAFTMAFIFGIFFYILYSFFLIFKIGTPYSAFRLLFMQSIFYLLIFNFLIRGKFRKND